MTPSAAPVLVAGGGPTGLVAALTLLQNGISVRIVTKELEYRLGQRGSGVWTHRRARPVLPIREYRPGMLEPHKTFTTIPHNDSTPSIPYNNLMFLGQPTLEGILRFRLAKYGCSVELGTELQSFEDNGERVLAKLVKRIDGEEIPDTFEASYLIGADGAKGVTRKLLGLSFLGETRQDFACAVGDICLEIKGVDREHWHFFGDRTTDFFMLRPTDEIAPDGFHFLITMKDYEPEQLIADQELMVKCMSKLTGHEIDIRKAIVLLDYRASIRMVDKFGIGRVFVAGDAAHVHSPSGGQGLNTGVQDALNLSWKLSLVHRDLSPVSLLDSYTIERLPVIAEMLDITTSIFNSTLSAPASDRVLLHERKLNMLGVNCRSSPIVLDEFIQPEPVNAYGLLEEGVLVAGDRAPDAPELVGDTETPTRLFDVFCPIYHTVLVFVQDASAAVDVLDGLKRYPKNLIRPLIILPQGSEVMNNAQVDVVVDSGGHAYRAYLAEKGEKKVVVVRPDGVVGAMVHGAGGVVKYFTKIFI